MNNKNFDKEQNDARLVSEWNFRFKNAIVYKTDYVKDWLTFVDAYKGEYFKNDKTPDYRSNQVSNYIFAIVETIRPIMLDNDPKFQSMPRQPEGMAYANDLQEALGYEWDRESMNGKLYRELINTLVLGTSVFFVPWNATKKTVEAIPVNPFNLFPDPLATSVDDAEYIIYASYKNVEFLKRLFPDKAEKLFGGDINYSELVNDNNHNARIDNQVLVLEVWTKDYEMIDEIDGDVKKSKPVYPKGRVLTLCPEIGVILDDKQNPYKDGKFPFVLIKDYDVPGKFWGEGEVAQLLSPQKYMNEMNNAIIDNAKTTANVPWIIDKNSGIGIGKITARPGLVIRKNPGSEVRRDQPPTMPSYVRDTIETFKGDIEMISGVHNTIRGENSSGVYTAQGILALQEAGQVRIRLKVKLLEDSLGKLAELWVSRMKQYWKDDKWLNITKQDGSYDLKRFTKQVLDFEYDVKIIAGSTMPVNRGAMLDLMIRLAQTQMPDGQTLVDRESVVEYLPEEVKAPLLKRMADNQSNLAEIQQAIEEIGQAMQEMQQMLQQVSEEGSKADEEQFGLIEELTSGLEELSNQILQLQEEYGKMVAEEEEAKRMSKIEGDFYNKGYGDAEKLYATPPTKSSNQEGVNEEETSMQLPDDILQGIESMSDEELQLLIEKHPNLIELIQ